MTDKKKAFQIMAVAMLFPGSFVLGLLLGLLAAALLITAICMALLLAALEWGGRLSFRAAAWLGARAETFFASFRGSAPETGTHESCTGPARRRQSGFGASATLPEDHVPLPEIVRVPRRERWLQ